MIKKGWFHKRYWKLVPQKLLKIRSTNVTRNWFQNVTQNWFHKRYSKLVSPSYSKLVPQTLLKIDSTNVTQNRFNLSLHEMHVLSKTCWSRDFIVIWPPSEEKWSMDSFKKVDSFKKLYPQSAFDDSSLSITGDTKICQNSHDQLVNDIFSTCKQVVTANQIQWSSHICNWRYWDLSKSSYYITSIWGECPMDFAHFIKLWLNLGSCKCP